MAFTVQWYGRAGLMNSTPFADEKSARDHASALFPARNANDGVVAVEVRKSDGTVVFSKAGRSK